MLRGVYHLASRDDAEAALEDWHRWAGTYDVAETNRLAKTLRSWEPEILAFFDTRLTNGPTEGRNLIVKQVKRQGFGYRNPPLPAPRPQPLRVTHSSAPDERGHCPLSAEIFDDVLGWQ